MNLLWLEGYPLLLNLLNIAKRRLNSTMIKLEKENLVKDYGQVFKEWQTEDIIEPVPQDELDKPAHYLPHRPVIKEASTTRSTTSI